MQSNTKTTPASSSQNSSTKSVLLIVGIVTVAVGLLMVALVVAVSGGAAFAVSRIRESKQQESKQTINAIAAAAAAYANDPQSPTPQQLPESTPLVPPSLSSVSRARYRSNADDWNAPGWKSMNFSLAEPQNFQYQWERTSDTSGVARAIGDLDVNRRPDVILELPVTCTRSPAWQCNVGTLRKAL